MIAQPIRTARLFSRRAIILSIRTQPTECALLEKVPISAREFRIVQHLILPGEPARFELSEWNFIEATSAP